MKKPPRSAAKAPSPPLDSALLAGVDLNLLVALDVLLAERGVTRAARRLGVTQSALSHMLSRLRDLFEDPLLVRTSHGMLPTALALDLEAPLRATLGELEQTLRQRPRFDPQTSTRQFTIASADYGMLVLLPGLVKRINAAAPSVRLIVHPSTPEGPEDLASGQIDMLVGAIPPEVPDVLGRRLFEEHFVCLVRRDHPTVRKSLTLEQYAALSHLLISPMGGGVTWVDPVLERLGLRRQIALRVPHFLIAPIIVAETDLIVTVAERVARTFVKALPLRMVVPPLEIPSFTVSMYWHPQRSDDPGHRWLREQLAETTTATLAAERGRAATKRRS